MEKTLKEAHNVLDAEIEKLKNTTITIDEEQVETLENKKRQGSSFLPIVKKKERKHGKRNYGSCCESAHVQNNSFEHFQEKAKEIETNTIETATTILENTKSELDILYKEKMLFITQETKRHAIMQKEAVENTKNKIEELERKHNQFSDDWAKNLSDTKADIKRYIQEAICSPVKSVCIHINGKKWRLTDDTIRKFPRIAIAVKDPSFSGDLYFDRDEESFVWVLRCVRDELSIEDVKKELIPIVKLDLKYYGVKNVPWN